MEELRKEDYEVQTTFNEDSIDVLVEDGEVENIDAEEVEGIGADGGFVKRTSKPGAGNKFYITDDRGGWSWCIQGSPTDPYCDVLANCVGYADGRFNEIIGRMAYPTLNCNAENFIERAKQAGLEVVDYPTLGGIMVMQRGATLSGGDGAGHVFIVEDILEYGSNGYASKIYTSESGYGSSAFWNSTRSNVNGRWGHGSSYSFRGCIVNPAVGKKNAYKENKPEPTPAPTPSDKFNIGDKVYIEGNLYVSSNASEPAGYTARKLTEITRKNPGSAHPYNTTGDLGWMDEACISKYEEPKPVEPPKPVDNTIHAGDIVTVNGAGNASSYGTSRSWTRKYNNHTMKVIMIADGRPYPYACNQYGEGVVGNAAHVTGWFRKEDVRK